MKTQTWPSSLCHLDFISSTQTKVTLEKDISVEEWPVGKPAGSLSRLMIDKRGPSSLMAGATSGFLMADGSG